MSELDWNDVPSAKRWLEQRFLGSVEAGSPLYQYLLDLGAKGIDTDRREEHLSTYELSRWLKANAVKTGIRYPVAYQTITFYPEYIYPGFLPDQQTNSTVEDRRRSISRKKGPARKRNGSKVSDVKSSKTSNKPKEATQSSERKPKGKTATHAERKSKGAVKGIQEMPEAEQRIRTLRPRVASRQRRETGKI